MLLPKIFRWNDLCSLAGHPAAPPSSGDAAARRTEIRAIVGVWAHTFPDGPPLAERVRTLEHGGPAGGIETVLIAVDHDRIAGALESLRLTQYLAGAAVPMFGLAAAGVAPRARRRGLARILCEFGAARCP